jgi:hypothetical protein
MAGAMTRAHVREDPSCDAVHAWMGRERVTITGESIRAMAYGGGNAMERVMEELYEAAKRDVRASLGPLDHPKCRTVRVGNRVRLVR